MSAKRLQVSLPPDLYERLARWAEREERVIDQQAAYLLKRAIESTAPAKTPSAQPAGEVPR